MRRGGLFWGVVLVLGGLALLVDNLNLLPFSLWSYAWPAALILFGGWMLLGAMRPRPAAGEAISVPLDGAASARVHVQHGAGRLEVGSGAGLTDLLSGSCDGGAEQRVARAGDVLDLDLRMPVHAWGPWDWGRGLTWSLRLNPAVPLTLEVDTGASDARLDLTELRVQELRLKTGASSSDVQLPRAAGQTRVVVNAGAASVSLQVPEGVAARIVAEAGAGAVDVSPRFPRAGRVHESPDYASALNRVDIDARIGAGSVSIR
jgi:hypothetical protein